MIECEIYDRIVSSILTDEYFVNQKAIWENMGNNSIIIREKSI